MDKVLIDYLKSGKAWVLIGSGPSNQMGYPSWSELASTAESQARLFGRGADFGALNSAIKRKDYPAVFQATEDILGSAQLLNILHDRLHPTLSGEIYDLIARWPVPVYLTTNYDDEIQTKLAELGEAYVPYSNSEDHFAFLSMDQQGAIFKLHGDLRSEDGLILTTRQYRAIQDGDEWEYWRTKMTSLFQMARVVVIGHSLSDENVRHVLRAAKRGAGVVQPVCWIAPNVDLNQSREFLEKFRIRVVPYDNRDGSHENLLYLLKHITQFIPPRTAIPIREQIARISQSPLGNSAAAPGFYVFNKLAATAEYDEKRVEVILASLQAALPSLLLRKTFTLQEALSLAGWPSEFPVPLALEELIENKAIESDILERVGDRLKCHADAGAAALENQKGFEHSRLRFEGSLKLRLKRSFPALSEGEISQITRDVESSLTGYFREGGLSLATLLFSSDARKHRTVPSSIIPFISEASAKYAELLHRQAFITVSTDIFSSPETAEKDYLGRISQGFFAFHSLGVFGDVAIRRFRQAKETVWLFDSNTHIPALALAASTNPVFADCFTRLKAAGIRMFTTGKLFDETLSHLRFADHVIRQFGATSAAVISAATGQAPYKGTNQFLEGFIRWQVAGNPADWEAYLYQIFGERKVSGNSLRTALEALGLEVVLLQDWPGFSDFDYESIEDYTQNIVRRMEHHAHLQGWDLNEIDFSLEALRKAKPEAEALVIIQEERDGNYHMLSGVGETSPAWFISNTSMLNILAAGDQPITWKPEAFLSFTTTLARPADAGSTERAFEAILWGCAQSGLSLVDERIIAAVFGGAIDQATVSLTEQDELYESTIGQKYGEPIESVLARIEPANKLLAAIQLTNEISLVNEERAKQAQTVADNALQRATAAEKKFAEVERFRAQMEARKNKGKRIARKQRNKTKSKKKAKKK